MKKILVLLVLLLVTSVIADAAGSKYTLVADGNAMTRVQSKAFANSRTDTVIITRDKACSGLAFAAYWRDSVSVTSVVAKRLVNGVAMAPVTADTLSAFSSLAGTSTTAVTGAITLAPLADAYMVLIIYAGSANGVTSATVDYEAIKQYSK